MKETIKWVLVFAILNILLSVTGQLLLLFFDNYGVSCSIIDCFFFWKALFFQILCFSAITFLTKIWIQKRYYYFIFPTLYFLFSNFIFFSNLKLMDDKVVFWISMHSFAHDFLDYNTDIITSFLYCRVPLYGYFDGGVFIPHNTIYFYVLFVVVPFVYYTILTGSCSYIVRKKLKLWIGKIR